MVKANVDRIIELLKDKKTISTVEMARALSIPKEDIQKSVEYLEEDGIVKIDYRLTTPYITMIKDPDAVKEQPPAVQPQQKKDEPVANGMETASSKPQLFQQVNNSQQQQPGPATVNNNYAFLLDNNNQNKPMFSASPDGNVNASVQVMDLSAETGNAGTPKLPDVNPLDEKPNFDMLVPNPEEKPDNKIAFKPVLSYTDNFAEKKEEDFPKYIESDVDKIDYLVDFANKKVTNHDYKDLNVLYRKIYSIYSESEQLTANEKYMVGEKVNSLFERIKRIYLIEEAA